MVRACELYATTAGAHALAVLPMHKLNTFRAIGDRGEAWMAHGSSPRIC